MTMAAKIAPTVMPAILAVEGLLAKLEPLVALPKLIRPPLRGNSVVPVITILNDSQPPVRLRRG